MDVQLVAAMGPPGGGRNAVTPRLLRHFSALSINAFSDGTMVRIFSSLVELSFRRHGFPSDCFSLGKLIVAATMEVSRDVLGS